MVSMVGTGLEATQHRGRMPLRFWTRHYKPMRPKHSFGSNPPRCFEEEYQVAVPPNKVILLKTKGGEGEGEGEGMGEGGGGR